MYRHKYCSYTIKSASLYSQSLYTRHRRPPRFARHHERYYDAVDGLAPCGRVCMGPVPMGFKYADGCWLVLKPAPRVPQVRQQDVSDSQLSRARMAFIALVQPHIAYKTLFSYVSLSKVPNTSRTYSYGCLLIHTDGERPTPKIGGTSISITV